MGKPEKPDVSNMDELVEMIYRWRASPDTESSLAREIESWYAKKIAPLVEIYNDPRITTQGRVWSAIRQVCEGGSNC